MGPHSQIQKVAYYLWELLWAWKGRTPSSMIFLGYPRGGLERRLPRCSLESHISSASPAPPWRGAQALNEQKWRWKACLIHGPCGHPNTLLFCQEDVEFLSSDTHGFSRTLGLLRIESRDSGFLAVTLKHYKQGVLPSYLPSCAGLIPWLTELGSSGGRSVFPPE